MLRRQFVGRIVSTGLGILLPRCQTDVPIIDRYFTSSYSAEHDHQLLIDEASWINPAPEGKTFTTTNNFGHVHAVFLTYMQLLELNHGEKVGAQSIDGDHVHFFSLCLKEV